MIHYSYLLPRLYPLRFEYECVVRLDVSMCVYVVLMFVCASLCVMVTCLHEWLRVFPSAVCLGMRACVPQCSMFECVRVSVQYGSVRVCCCVVCVRICMLIISLPSLISPPFPSSLTLSNVLLW